MQTKHTWFIAGIALGYFVLPRVITAVTSKG